VRKMHTKLCKSDEVVEVLDLRDTVVVKLQLREAVQANKVINILNSCNASTRRISCSLFLSLSQSRYPLCVSRARI